MKKLITTVCAIAISFSINAQDYTPKSGDWSIGTDATSMLNYVGNLFNSNATAPTVDFAGGAAISGKMFTDDMTAWRAKANLGLTSTDDGMGHEESGFNLTVGLGKEFRRGGERLQGYYGYMAHISIDSETHKEEGMDDEEHSGMGFGASGFIGVEYFVMPKIGLSAEYSHGLSYESHDEAGTETTDLSIGGSTTSLGLNFYF